MASQVVGEHLVGYKRPVDDLLVNNCCGQRRDHGDHRAHPDRHGTAVRQQDAVIEKAVTVIPKPNRLKGFRDTGEVLEELNEVTIFPAAHNVTTKDKIDGAVEGILAEMKEVEAQVDRLPGLETWFVDIFPDPPDESID